MKIIKVAKKKIMKNKLIGSLAILLISGIAGILIFADPANAPEAQAAIGYLRPTAYTDSARKTTNPLMAIDSLNGATFSSTAYGISKNPSITFRSWQTTGEVYANIYLKVRYHADAGQDDTYAIAYSTNGCAGIFTNLVAPTSAGASDRTISSLDLGSSLNLSNLCVKVYTQRVSKDDGKKLYIHDIWTEGAYTQKDSDGNLSAGSAVIEPAVISSLADTSAERVVVADFTISDGGSSDGLPLIISQIVLHTSGTGNFNDLTWQLEGPDANFINGTVENNTITFSSLNVSVANGAAETYTVYAYFFPACASTDGSTFLVSVDGDTDLTVSGSGTQIGATSPVDNGAGFTMEILQTKLIFSTQPSISAIVNTDFPGTIAVSATDMNNNVDKDFNEEITLSAVKDSDKSQVSGILSSADTAGLTKTSINGTATWVDTKYDLQEIIDIKAVSSLSYLEGIYSQPVVVGPPSLPVWGVLHSIHTTISDGAETPSQRADNLNSYYSWASTADHDIAISSTEWTAIRDEAKNNNFDNNFTYFAGYEWKGVSVNNSEIVGFFLDDGPATKVNGNDPSYDDFGEFLAWLAANNGIGCANHPARSSNTFNWADPEVNNETYLPCVEMLNKTNYHWDDEWTCAEGSGCATYANPKPDSSNWNGGVRTALDNGLHLGFVAGWDYHGVFSGTPTAYTGLVNPSSHTRAGVLETIRSRHTWAAEDKILVSLIHGQNVMGDKFNVTESEVPLDYTVKAVDGQTITNINLFLDGVIMKVANFSSQTVDGSFTINLIDKNEHYVFIEAIQANGKRAWSSPMYITRNINSPIISSVANQVFEIGQETTTAEIITITDDAISTITAANDIRIKIPTSFNMTWDTLNNLANIGGTDWAKTGAISSGGTVTVTYEDDDKTVVIPVTSDFGAGGNIIVYGLSFANFSAVSSADKLEIEVDNAGTSINEDDKTVTIREVPSGITLIQQKTAAHTYGSPSTSLTTTLSSSATAGNLIVTGIAIDKASGTITPPAGFTLIQKGEGLISSGAMAYKIATGGETAITWSYANNEEGSAWVGEYSGLMSGALDNSAENEAYLNTATNSISTGATSATTQANELAIAIFISDSGNSVGTARSWTNGFTTIAEKTDTSGSPFINVASKILISTGAVESTVSHQGSDESYAVVATFK